ncbi:MAG TPA: MBL fold metallo-hydrolase [Sumerlaeia bacterium]|nr:MBL fold metallo-hydrolase [Sumerlaeia bacterium]
MRIRVLGSGTSTGVPAVGCECPVCRSRAPENKRLRSSILVERAGRGILVDCSTDFRQQALLYGLDRIDAVLMTHDHADHINGIDDLRPLCAASDRPVPVYGDETVLETFRRRFRYCFHPPQTGGGVPNLDLRPIEPAVPFLVDGLEVVPAPVKHGVLDILGFRLGPDLAYLTDCSAVPDSSLALLRGVKVLIVDALRPKPHPTHFGLGQALEFSRRLRPEQTWFTHISCRLEHFAANASLPSDAQLLHDGQVIEIADGADERVETASPLGPPGEGNAR